MEAFGKYQLLKRLGAGGMAEVFLAREPLADGLAKILVLKKIHPSLAETPQFRKMFEDEAKVAVNLNHPNIVQTFGYGQIGPTYFLAMEHVEGVDLLRILNAAAERRVRVPFGLCGYVGQQVAKALDYAHRKTDEFGRPLSIVHRDISPQNVLVSFDGMVKLVDFGIARSRLVEEDAGIVKGKFAYMSPEQAMGAPVDGRSDIFSMGILLWELSLARALFGGLKGREAVLAIKMAQVPAPRELDPAFPPELERIILRCLQRKPEDRFATARDLSRALGQFFFALSGKEGQIFESGTLAAFLSQLLSDDERGRAPAPANAPALAPPPVASKRDGEARLQAPSEHKAVVVVEGKLAGLPALRRGMGEARARQALLDFLRVAEHVAYKHGAHPNRLDERGLTFVVGLPAGTEDDAARAIALSRALVDTLDGISRELSPPLHLALGLSRGTALLSKADAGPGMSYTLVGDSAEVARRLAGEAMPGEVLVAGEVYRGARADYRFEELETLSSDGRDAAAVRVHRLLGPRPRADRLADAEGPLRLVGRDADLAALGRAYDAAVRERRARYVALVGEAGVGKASIVSAFRHRLPPAACQVVRAVGRPSLRDTPYALVADLLRDIIGLSDEAEPRQVKRRIEATLRPLFDGEPRELPKIADALSVLLGASVPGADDLEAGERRRRVYHAMRRLQARLAEARPLLVVIEDLHWADAQSLEILAALVRDPLDRPVLGIATARYDDRRPGDRLGALMSADQLTTLLVGDLGPSERAELVASRLVRPEDARALGQRILDGAGGNPFYIHEIIDSLVERGILAPDPTDDKGRLVWLRPEQDFRVPTTVEALVASRLDRLPDDERDLLRRAALLGRIFRVEDLIALSSPLDERTVSRALVRLSARGLIAPASAKSDVFGSGPAAYSFRNTITKDVAYAGLSPSARALLHSVAADRLVRSPAYRAGADDARLSDHLLLAGDRGAAGRALVSAALYARDQVGNLEAYRLLERAVPLLDPDDHELRYRVHAEREQILRGVGKRPAQLREIHHLRKEASLIGGRDGKKKEAEAYCRLGRFYLDVGRHPAARRELERAQKRAQEADDPLSEAEALRLSALLLMNIGKNADALALLAAARSVLGDSEGAAREALLERAQIQSSIGNVQVQMGRLKDALTSDAEALVIYRRLGARRLEAAVLSDMGSVFVGLGEHEEALSHFKRALKLAQAIGDRASIGHKLASIGQTYAELGDFARARSHYDKALEIHTALEDEPGLADALISSGQLSLREGAPARAERELERGLELAGKTRNRYQEIRALVYLALGRLAAEGDDTAAGAFDLAESATRLAREAEIANGEAHGLCVEALALARLGRIADAVARSTAAVAVLDSGRSIDSPEEIWLVRARVAEQAGDRSGAKQALERALAEVRLRARKLSDEGWQKRYLAAPPARDILAEAERLGVAGAAA